LDCQTRTGVTLSPVSMRHLALPYTAIPSYSFFLLHKAYTNAKHWFCLSLKFVDSLIWPPQNYGYLLGNRNSSSH